MMGNIISYGIDENFEVWLESLLMIFEDQYTVLLACK